MPNPVDPKFQPVVSDDALYRSLLDRNIAAAQANAAREGRRYTDKNLNQCASDADAEAKASPFAIAATALIRGDSSPLRELCARVRAESGDGAADELVRRIEAAVAEKRAMLKASEDARQRRNRHRRPW
jgi:hypothetical protein